MPRSLKFLFILLIICSTTQAQQHFIDDGDYPLSTHTFSEKYCSRIDRDREFCQAYTLSSIDGNDSNIPDFLKGVEAYIDPTLTSYRQFNLKKEVSDTLSDFGNDISGHWYDETRIGLFAKTQSTYTLSFESNGYSGGAHGYYTVTYTNVDIRTKKSLSLQDLFLPGSQKRLYQVALSYYKTARNLNPSQSLTQDGWFENRFRFAENFAITPYGLYFLYNQYEIKPYAEGQTSFFLPYGAIGDLIDPKGPLAFALELPPGRIEAAFDNECMQLSVDVVRKGDRVTITAHLVPLKHAKHLWLSVSLPQISSKRQLLSTGYDRFQRVIPYDTGNRIYNSFAKKAIPAKYVLVEADKVNPGYDENHTMWFRVKIPPELGKLIIDIRATMKKEKRTCRLPEFYEGITGEQGYKNYRVILPMRTGT